MVHRRRQRHAGVKMVIMMAGAAVGLSGCGGGTKSSGVDPIEWYRDISGESKNDPADKTAPNAKNLEQGGKMPFPNLASVPKEPDSALTKADREKMAQSLLADRANAQYTDEELRAGQNMQAVTPPPPPVSMAPSPNATTASAAGSPAAAAPKTAAAPGQGVTQPQSRAATPRGRQTAAIPSAAGPARENTAEASPPPAHAAKKADARKRQVRRGSEQPPQESSLRSPTIGSMPKGAEAREPPPKPVEPATPRTEEVAAATPVRGALESGKTRRSGGQAVEIRFRSGPFRDRIPEAEHNRLVEVARLVERNNNARVRIVGYGGAAPQGDKAERDFESFDAALGNAKAVGIELARLGVPPNRIDIETKASPSSADRAEIFVEY